MEALTAKHLLLYFVVGGLVISLTTYAGSKGQGLLAAFIALFPAATVLTFSLIYLNAGVGAMVAYAKGLLLFTPAWILYVMCVTLGSPRIGFPAALLLGICIYVLGALATSKVAAAL